MVDVYEECPVLESKNYILRLIKQPAYEFFKCDQIITKAAPYAKKRIEALKQAGYQLSEDKMIGHDGTEYGDYWVK